MYNTHPDLPFTHKKSLTSPSVDVLKQFDLDHFYISGERLKLYIKKYIKSCDDVINNFDLRKAIFERYNFWLYIKVKSGSDIVFSIEKAPPLHSKPNFRGDDLVNNYISEICEIDPSFDLVFYKQTKDGFVKIEWALPAVLDDEWITLADIIKALEINLTNPFIIDDNIESNKDKVEKIIWIKAIIQQIMK